MALASNLLKFVKEQGGCPEHNLLLVADAAIQWSTGLEMIAEGHKAFKNTGLVISKESVIGWPKGANALFKTAAKHCKEHFTSFLWLEPDCVPMRPGWAKELQREWNARPKDKKVMGRIYSSNDSSLPARMMSGIGVYPEDAIDLIGHVLDGDRAFDMAAADTLVPLCHNTKLIQHFWGQPNLAPTFAAVRTKDSPINTFTLDMVDSQAAIFHRVKEGSLIKLLRGKMGLSEPEKPAASRKFDVVFPFCATDADLALQNIHWMAELNHYSHTMILAIDDQSRLVNEILQVAQQCFEQVIVFKYPLPPVPGHPQAANWAFRHTARYMQQRGNPWFWCEPDLIPLKPEWLDVLQDEYSACGMDCMGAIVPDLGWINGTSIYPPNLAETCPVLMNTPDGHWAFDTVIHPEIVNRTHNCAHLMFHVWAQMSDLLLPYGSGQLPSFYHKGMLRQIPPTAMAVHRVKDASLINLLRAQIPK